MARRLTAAIVLAAGAGTRFGAAKQFAHIDGVTLLEHACRTASAVAGRVVVVVPPGEDLDERGRVTGGATRRESVAAGLAALDDEGDDATVLVHDAAHPLATADLARRVADRLLAGARAVVPACAATDTVKTVAGELVTATVARGAMLVQMPQAYVLGVLRSAHRLDVDAQDDSGLVEALGVAVHVVEGEVGNIHVTTPEELDLACAIAPLVTVDRAAPPPDRP